MTLQEFLAVPPDQVECNVPKFNSGVMKNTTYTVQLEIPIKGYCYSSSKRYTEFQGFYDSLTLRYQNLNFPAFPSKFQVINKEESRKRFFETLCRTVIKLAIAHQEIKNDLMKLLFEFVHVGGGGVETYSEPTSKKEAPTCDSTYDNSSQFDKNSVTTLSTIGPRGDDKVSK